MGEIIFAQPRWQYDSYQDFRALVTVSGFRLIYVDEIPREGVSENVYIVTPLNGEWEHGIVTDGRVIWWDLEWRLDGAYPQVPGVSEVWTSDRWYSQRTETRYVPMGSHPDLRPSEPADGAAYDGAAYDGAYLAYMIPRRQRIHHELRERGVRLSPTGAWGSERHAILSHATAYLHVHQLDNAPTIAPLRMIVAAAYRLPVISESVADAGIFTHTYLMTSAYAQYADFVRMWVCGDDRQRLNDYGGALHDLLCRDLTFRRCVEQAL